MSDILDVEQVRAMATPAGALWAGERAPTALALARTALEWFARWSTVHAAEEARDLAIMERDEAYKQRDTAVHLGNALASERDEARRQRNVAEEERGEAVRGLRDASSAQRSQVSAILGKTDEESQVEAAHRVMAALAEARRERDEARAGMALALKARDEANDGYDRLAVGIIDARAILGAAPGELLSDAAQRAVSVGVNASAVWQRCEGSVRKALGAKEGEATVAAADRAAGAGPHKTVLDEVRTVLGVLPAESVVAKAKWIMEARAKGHEMQNEREAEIDRLRRRVAELEAAESDPPQVFRIIPRVTVDQFGVRFEVTTRDPGIRALTADQLSRLGLVVCDE